MVRNFLVFNVCMLLGILGCNAQDEIKACIIQIENGKIYLDVTAPKTKIGDVLSVRSAAGYMVHPVTKKKIMKEGEILADLEITEIHSEYSVANIYPENAISKLKVGMYASMPEVITTQAETLSNTSEMLYFPVAEKNEVMLQSGTIIPMQAVSSVRASKVEKGQSVEFRVTRGIVVDGELIIPAGIIVKGKVYQAKKSKWVGTKGRLGIKIDYLELPSGQNIPLTSSDIYITGKNRTALSVITSLFFTPCLFICGSKAEMPAGYNVNAMVASSITIPIN